MTTYLASSFQENSYQFKSNSKTTSAFSIVLFSIVSVLSIILVSII